MKLHNKSALLGVYAILELAAEPERLVTASEVAEKYKVSQHHLAKVMRTLVWGGLAKAVRGVGGGYRFSGDADRVTLLTIVELFEEVDGSVNGFGDELAGENPVVGRLQTLAAEMKDLTRTVLESISLNDVLKGIREGFVLRAQDLEMQKTIIGVAL